jgi:hypothetical protein
VLLSAGATGLAELGGWPTVYWVAGGLMLVMAAAMRLRALYGAIGFAGLSVLGRRSPSCCRHRRVTTRPGPSVCSADRCRWRAGGKHCRPANGGRVRCTTEATAILLAVSWIPIAFAHHSIARARLTSACRTVYFLGGVVGSAGPTFADASDCWAGVCLLGGGIGALTTIVWLVSSIRS